MTDNQKTWDSVNGWSLCLVALWTLFFLLGLFPEAAFWYFRDLGAVAGQHALVNSPWSITLGWVVFMMVFVYSRCGEAGHDESGALARTVETGLIALVAFMPVDLQLLPDYLAVPYPAMKYLLVGAVSAKLLCALYLFLLVLAYSLWWGLRVFEHMKTLLPSGHAPSARDHLDQSPVSLSGQSSDTSGDVR
ncbi:MAG TPA: hypothetical protein PK379_07625 [Candidatus Hydrogenedentes bacterium]|nr:hypothetical protein [Candidatus Hydrogenedentota bacterium]HOJ68201.1 hypothetical protein [Candidatus Hydrogenedentota bacterium]HOK89882.1 hypothetical protein [Candidatus Hydrogenedentota bacterium]